MTAEKLKNYRKKSGFTLRKLEEITGISNAYLSQLENDKIKNPSANILLKLCKIYDVAIEEMMSEKKQPSTPTVPAYVEVLASEELPEKFVDVIVKTDQNILYKTCRMANGKWDDYPFRSEKEKVTHWLKPVPAPSKDKREIASEAWDACKRHAAFDKDALGNPIPNKEQYLNSIL